ncbi:MAG: glycoside hydrolase family 36 protein [Candidatus Fimenecus sp.]
MNFDNLTLRAVYTANGKEKTTDCLQNEDFEIKTKTEGNCLFAFLVPHTAVSFKVLQFIFPRTFEKTERVFVNGYQSWTDSFEYAYGESMRELTKLTEFCITKTPIGNIGFPKSGDSLFWKYPRTANVFYGWSYGYIRNENTVEIFGSLSERSGYTVVTFDMRKNAVFIDKELAGVTFTTETELLSLAVIKGEYDAAFDEYFAKMGVTCRETKRRTGYTTWYNYYGNVDEKVVRRDLASIKALDVPFDCFQIDDGYQAAIGDWLCTDTKKFPSGMKSIADDIHAGGMLAGLWLAPFAGVKKSKLFGEHPDWFIKDENGKPYKTGHNWGGFYSLDIYNEGARKYLKDVFNTILNEWGFDLVKLDFLYGACVLPMHNKSRGEIMCDAMDFIRECCGDKLILGCGVPMMPAFGKVDYCRIGSDISMKWKQKKDVIREEVSTPHAVCNSIFRRHLDGRAWKNDPDVFLLRDQNNKMTFEERKLLAKINSTFGNLLFISDNVSEYTPEQLAVLKDTFADKNVTIQSAEFIDTDMMKTAYTENGKVHTLCFHIRTGKILEST